MKLQLLCLAAVIAVVYSESCTMLGDCTATTCSTGYGLHCIDSLCTCTISGGACTSNADCDCGHHAGHTPQCDNGVCHCINHNNHNNGGNHHPPHNG